MAVQIALKDSKGGKSKGQAKAPAPASGVLPAAPTAAAIRLQQTLGNRAVQRLMTPAGAGKPLESGVREQMESLLGHDFGAVRVHTDDSAGVSARAMGARGYASGNHVVFARGRYAPHTTEGRGLLAHELAHVAQQERGATGTVESLEGQAERAERLQRPSIPWGGGPRWQVQLSPERATRLSIDEDPSGKARFTVQTDEGNLISATGSSKGLEAGTYQISAAAGQGALTIRKGDGSALPTMSRFYIDIPGSAVRMHQLLTAVRKPIPLDVREGRVAAPDATKKDNAGSEPEDPQDAVAKLPQRLRSVIFSEAGAFNIGPNDYPAVLRIAKKLAELSDSELEAYRDRTAGKAGGLAEFEASIDNYIAEVQLRRQTILDREKLKTQLYGLDAVYAKYQRLETLQTSTSLAGALSAANPRGGGMALGSQPTINRLMQEITDDLKPYGFDNITAFERVMSDFVTTFRTEAILIARNMLDRTEHALVEQQQRYEASSATSALYKRLKPAREHYEAANKIRHDHASMPLTLEESAEQSYWSGQFREEQGRGRQAAATLKDDPVVSARDFPQEDAFTSDEDDFRGTLRTYIKDRRKDVQDTRQNLVSSPDVVFELDAVLDETYDQAKIRPNSIYRKIIQSHIHDIHVEEAVKKIALGVFALAAGLVSGGTGAVAVFGAATAFGVGAYQAVQEFHDYERKSAAYGAQLSNEEPSAAWVILSVAAAGVDLASAVSAVRAMKPALQLFEETGDAAKLEQQLAKLSQVNEKVRASVVRGAREESASRAAWKAILKPPQVLRVVLVPLLEEFGRLCYAVYRTFKQGIVSFEEFLLRREAADLIKDIANLSPEELTLWKASYARAMEEMRKVAAHGESLSLAENETRAFMRMWGEQGKLTPEQVMEQMNAWKAAKKGGIPFGFADAEHFADFRAVAQKELARAVKGADNNAQAFLQGSSLSGVSYARQVPFDAASDLDVAVVSRYLFKKGRAAGFEVGTSPARIGPLDIDQLKELGLNRMVDKMEDALTEAGAQHSRQVNVMLFDNEAAMRSPIGSASTETTRAAVPLKVDAE